jgi:hypothetical protein
MKKILFISICLCSFFIARSQSLSPEVIATAGDYYVGSNASLSWTLGEPIIETFTATGNILTQGFQQPTYDVTGIDDRPGSKNENYTDINVFPNPASDYLNVNFIKISHSGVTVQMYDLQGKVVIDKQMQTNALQQLDLGKISKGNYILRFTSPSGEVLRSFKVVKN